MCRPAEWLSSLHLPPHFPSPANLGSWAARKEKGPEINTVFNGKALKRGQSRSNLLTRSIGRASQAWLPPAQAEVEAPERQIAVINPREERLASYVLYQQEGERVASW